MGIKQSSRAGTPWHPWIRAGQFTRASDSTFTVADNASNQDTFEIGRPLRYRSTAGTWRYGLVEGYMAGTVNLCGAKMTLGDDDELQWADFNRVVVKEGAVAGRFADAASLALLEDDDLVELEWPTGPAYLVEVYVKSGTDDAGGNQPHVGALVDGSQVCTSHGNQGPQCIDTEWTTSGVDINTAHYKIERNEPWELTTDAGGTSDDSVNLSWRLIFVLA